MPFMFAQESQAYAQRIKKETACMKMPHSRRYGRKTDPFSTLPPSRDAYGRSIFSRDYKKHYGPRSRPISRSRPNSTRPRSSRDVQIMRMEDTRPESTRSSRPGTNSGTSSRRETNSKVEASRTPNMSIKDLEAAIAANPEVARAILERASSKSSDAKS